MKKRLVTLFMAVGLVFSLAGCGSTEVSTSTDNTVTESKTQETETSTKKSQSLTLATGGTGGTYYALGGAMATEWGNTLDGISVSAISTGASVENMNLINAGELDLGISMNSIADDCWNGTGAFVDAGAQTNFYTLGVVYPEVFQIVCDASKGATTLSELAGLKVAIGPVGSGTASASEIVFQAAGMDITSDITAERDSFSDATAKMQDGHIDASCAVLAVPASAITELETSKSISFVNISDTELAAIQEKFPYYTRFVIPAGTYSNTEDINTVTCQAALYCTKDLDDETAYQLVKSFYENGSKIAATHSAGQYISVDTAIDGLTTQLHPGAIKYYEEMGITIPDYLK